MTNRILHVDTLIFNSYLKNLQFLVLWTVRGMDRGTEGQRDRRRHWSIPKIN
jgi:hypothetical protein